jgi:hypothetical protein
VLVIWKGTDPEPAHLPHASLNTWEHSLGGIPSRLRQDHLLSLLVGNLAVKWAATRPLLQWLQERQREWAVVLEKERLLLCGQIAASVVGGGFDSQF